MRYGYAIILASALFICPLSLCGETAETQQESTAPLKPFTGKITRNKVRLRAQPTLDSKILRELDKGEILLVVGESDEFYAIRPPEDFKVYVFRSYIIDNVVEGNHVNIRLEPDTESPVLGQLNNGDHVDGNISPLNSKWIEITPPGNISFYVAKDYVEKVGDANAITDLKRRGEEANLLLSNARQASQEELKKPYEQISADSILLDLNKIITQYPDFTEHVKRAKELLTEVQEELLQKKLAYLESKAHHSTTKMEAQQARLDQLEQQLKTKESALTVDPEAFKAKVESWIPVEDSLYFAWQEKKGGGALEEFYEEQKSDAVILTGIIEPYIRAVRNKPGDYMLIARNSKLPTAYLYSTKVDLSGKIGKEVTLIGLPRPNNNFAHPAYYIISIE